MFHSLRLAIGTVQRETDSQVMCWALMGALRQLDLDVQHFYGQACLAPIEGAASITGVGSRHLDSWLMSPETCRQLYQRASRQSDISIVEGCYAAGLPEACRCGGTLELLCDWLALPKIAMIDVTRLVDCRLPQLPAGTEGLLLDRVRGLRGLVLEQTRLESLYGIPVLGALPGLAHARRMIARLPHGSTPASSICRELGNVFCQHAKLEPLLRLADRPSPQGTRRQAAPRRPDKSAVRIGVAYDSAFNSYFRDTLDQLELFGAEVITFSPLKDEQLPACDIVYIGAGQPDQFADQLAENQCMLSSLRSHYRGGGRIYAEGGGLAYLCHTLETLDGQRRAMVGAIPAVAERKHQRELSEPMELTLGRRTWLADAGTRLRGYANSRWHLCFTAGMENVVLEPRHQSRVIAARGLVGSLLHINFAAQPSLLASFFDPWPTAAQPALAL